MSNNIKEINNVKFRYSYNPEVTAALTKEEGGKRTRGWIFNEISWNEAEISNMIRTQSYIPSELKDGYKVASNVKKVYNIVLDFDQGEPTLESFITQVKDFRFKCVVHSTINHKKNQIDQKTGQPIPNSEKDKFRVIIPLKEPISLSEYESCCEFWLNKFPTLDKSSFQGNRYYMVSPKAEIYFHDTYMENGKTVEAKLLDVYAEKIISVPSKKRGKSVSEKKEGSFTLDDIVRLPDGTEIRYRDITEKTQVICPFCDPSKRQHPNNHNAFVDYNNAGNLYLYCSSESKTYWSNSEELDASKSRLFFNESIGYACRIVDYENSRGYSVFKNNDDWNSYCNTYKINPSCKTHLPRLRIVFDPSKPSGLQNEYYNLFHESGYLSEHDITLPILSGDEVLSEMALQTPVIYAILMNIFGEAEYLKRFLNWNAVILTKRMKTDTAWLITSKTQGIGKGLLFDRILRPIYGERQSILVQGERIGQKFNSQDQSLWLKVFDEVYAPSDARENLSRREWLKHIITAREHTIELKGVDPFQVTNHMNVILYSNNECPIFLEITDRRYNVVRNENAVKPQELPFYKGNNELRESVDSELKSFASLLLRYDCDIELANTAIETTAKTTIQEVTADAYEEFAEALRNKDTDYFLLSEIFPKSEKERMFSPHGDKSFEETEVESAISDGYIPSKYMSKICKYFFKGNYKQILARLRLKSVIKKTKNTGMAYISVYKIQ